MDWFRRELRIWVEQLTKPIGPHDVPVWHVAILINALVYSGAYIVLKMLGWT